LDTAQELKSNSNRRKSLIHDTGLKVTVTTVMNGWRGAERQQRRGRASPPSHHLSRKRTSLRSPFFHSAHEVLCFNLYLAGDVRIMVVLEHDFPCCDLGRVFGLETAHH